MAQGAAAGFSALPQRRGRVGRARIGRRGPTALSRKGELFAGVFGAMVGVGAVDGGVRLFAEVKPGLILEALRGVFDALPNDDAAGYERDEDKGEEDHGWVLFVGLLCLNGSFAAIRSFPYLTLRNPRVLAVVGFFGERGDDPPANWTDRDRTQKSGTRPKPEAAERRSRRWSD